MTRVRIALLAIAGIALLALINYALFTGRIFGLPAEVRAALESDAAVSVTLIDDDAWLVLQPSATDATTGVILFPEGRMDIRTYAPIGRQIASEGFLVVLLSRRVDTDLDVAKEAERIDAVIDAHPEVTTWAVGGHTWGAPPAAAYARSKPNAIDGVVLWAGRLDDTSSLSESTLPVLMVYGTLDDDNTDLVAGSGRFLPPQTVWTPIDGGNRVQFGSYGPMAADVGATISTAVQQTEAARATVTFLNTLTP